MANLKVDTISGIGTEGPVLNGGLHFRSKNYLTLPKGTTAERTATSSGISTEIGSIRYNTDSNKMECYVNNKWMIVSTSSPNLDGGTRGFAAGGASTGGYSATVDFYTIPTQGNAQDFGDLSRAKGNGVAGFASKTRGVAAGGFSPTAHYNTIDFITMSSTGDGTDFGDLTSNREGPMGLSNATRGIAASGWSRGGPGLAQTTIDYVTIASAGNALDYGDMAAGSNYGAGAASPTRGILLGGNNESPAAGMKSRIEFITIASTGDAQQFGDLTLNHFYNITAASNSTRALAWGGTYPDTSTATNIIEFITIASKGNGVDFGDTTRAVSAPMATASSTRSVCYGGNGGGDNIIEYVQIATQGNAVDFGDTLSGGKYGGAGFSNGHGGL